FPASQFPGAPMTRDILDQIDHVLDGDTSPDAMRWTPEPVAPPRMPTAPDFARLAIRVNLEPFVRVDLEPFVTAMRRMAEQVGALMTKHQRTFHLIAVASAPPRDRRRHIIRCGVCNPQANPPPLPRAARGYDQRRRARRRRGVGRGRR
ncbi:MAG: hypothetical protein ACRDOJ_11985, partial [Nocardioidaceae bacterium]